MAAFHAAAAEDYRLTISDAFIGINRHVSGFPGIMWQTTQIGQAATAWNDFQYNGTAATSTPGPVGNRF